MHNAGSTGSQMLMQTKALIAQHLTNQAFIEGVNDDFLIGTLLTVILIIPIFFFKVKKRDKNKKTQVLE